MDGKGKFFTFTLHGDLCRHDHPIVIGDDAPVVAVCNSQRLSHARSFSYNSLNTLEEPQYAHCVLVMPP